MTIPRPARKQLPQQEPATESVMMCCGAVIESGDKYGCPNCAGENIGSLVQRAVPPRCRCGKPCVYYGATGGYSVGCVSCNAANALRQRRARSLKQPG